MNQFCKYESILKNKVYFKMEGRREGGKEEKET
jgi:hypothetical protein